MSLLGGPFITPSLSFLFTDLRSVPLAVYFDDAPVTDRLPPSAGAYDKVIFVLSYAGKIALVEVVQAHGDDFNVLLDQIRRELAKIGEVAEAVCNEANIGFGVVTCNSQIGIHDKFLLYAAIIIFSILRVA